IVSFRRLMLLFCYHLKHSSIKFCPAHPGKGRPCCVDVTNMDMSAEVVGETYRQQAARPPCVKAIIFNTGNGGQLCADPNAHNLMVYCNDGPEAERWN
uniref:Chemokine interleukin-8-like domain-containing protein n=1 Tax=Neolamprologus brichardi TaxID=32507 RepID=A0A3Q4GAA7_NEOBR